jgi:hypothetical protein
MTTSARLLLLFTAAVAAACLAPCCRAKAVSDEDLATYLRVKAALEQKDAGARQKVENRIPIVREKEAEKQAKFDDTFAFHGRLELVPEVSKPRIRRSFADLLATEAGNLGGFFSTQDRDLKDLKGALFSYTNDFEHGFDTWTAQAALIWPIIFKTGVTPRGQFCMPLFGVMPSISVDRFTTNRQPKDAEDLKKIEEEEINEVVYRLGGFAQFDFTDTLFAIVRANARWQTDTGHESSEPGFEIELEPLWQSETNPALGLGFLAIPKWARRAGFDPNDRNTYKHVWFAYQARLRARFLGGSVRDDGDGKEGPEYSRAGLTAELNLTPFIFERLSASASYSFMPVISGNISRDFFLEAGLAYTIFESRDESQKVTAELKYLWGAPDNKGEKLQDQLTASIGVIF